MTTAAEDVERTARDTTVALWGVASVVMLGSMVAGGFAFYHLNPSWWSAAIGIVTALAVDLALAQWLRIGRRIRAAGVEVFWGRALEFTTAGMTLYLNVGAALFVGLDPATAKKLLAVAHSFLPVVLVLVSLAGSEAYQKLQRVRRETEAADRAAHEAARRPAVAAQELKLARQAELERAHHDAELELIRRPPADVQSAPGVTPLPRRHKTRKGSTAGVRKVWIEQQIRAGRDVTGSDVKAEFPDASNMARDVAAVRSRLTQEHADRRGSVHAVGGKQR